MVYKVGWKFRSKDLSQSISFCVLMNSAKIDQHYILIDNYLYHVFQNSYRKYWEIKSKMKQIDSIVEKQV